LLGSELELQIICADDTFYNLEALGLIFEQLKLLNFVRMFNNGQQAIDYFIQTTE